MMIPASIEDTILEGMARQNVPGCAIALIEGGAVTAIGCYGNADRRTGAAVTAETRFSLQSISKSYAAWAAMRLVEEGRLDLDAPISRYLRRWRLPASTSFDLDGVTARRLLTHHAGVTVAGFRGVALDQPRFTLIDAMEGRLPPPDPHQVRHYAYWSLPRDDDQVTVTHAPGSGYRYSNAGFGVLELAIEDITGLAYDQWVAQAVFEPLGMTQSAFARRPGPPHAQPHDREGRAIPDYRWLCRAAAGVYASINDLARFTCASMSGAGRGAGGGALSADSVAILHTPQAPAETLNGRAFQTGLGHLVLDVDGVANVHHSGGSIGWRSIFSAYPSLGSGICMILNGEAANEVWQPVVMDWSLAARARA